MVERIEHFPVQDLFEVLEVDDKAGPRVQAALHRHFEGVVVPVSVRVVALAEDAAVLLRGEFRVVIKVRRGELGLARQIDDGAPVVLVAAFALGLTLDDGGFGQ